MLKRCLPVVLFILNAFWINAQEANTGLRISLLTCSPGQELYSVFGHSALRIVDSAAGTDIVYNYGTFDFNDPDFYTKFVRGRLRYFLSQSSFADFMYEYAYFKRPVKEQVLSISSEEKRSIQQALFENISGENRYYRYDFLFDNCTTRLRDLIFRATGKDEFLPPSIAEKGTTFRDYLHVYLDQAHMPWTKLGIDLLLGAGTDQVMNVKQSMFLPNPLMEGVSLAKTNGSPLEQESSMLLDYPVVTAAPLVLTDYSPLLVFLLIAIASLWGSFSKMGVAIKLTVWSDLLLFGLSGIMGVILMLAWFGTDHESFRFNLNLLWASPLNLLFFYERIKSSQLYKKWLIINSLLVLLLCGGYLIWPGIINPSLFPFIIAMSLRSWIGARS